MRGKRVKNEFFCSRDGITPAHAGKTHAEREEDAVHGDHPRACGENEMAKAWAEGDEGSPPRMRGKPRRPARAGRSRGITPAHAGKTTTAPAHMTAPRDHPRACGENEKSMRATGKVKGSPPRMRGKLRPHPCCRRTPGITPAHAGKTLRKWRISVVDPSPQPRSPLTSRRADASSGSQRAPCAAPV